MEVYVNFSKPIGAYFEALSFSFSLATPSMAGGPYQQAQTHNMTFTKEVDYLSAKIWSHSIKGTIFPEVIVEFYKKVSFTPYLVYTTTEVMILSLSASGNREQIAINYNTIKLDY